MRLTPARPEPQPNDLQTEQHLQECSILPRRQSNCQELGQLIFALQRHFLSLVNFALTRELHRSQKPNLIQHFLLLIRYW